MELPDTSPEILRLYASIYRKPRRYFAGDVLHMPNPFDLVRADLADQLAKKLEDAAGHSKLIRAGTN